MEAMETLNEGIPFDLRRLIQRIVESAENVDKSAMESWYKQVDLLSQVEKDAVISVLSRMKEQGNLDLLEALWEIDFDTKPVGIEEFLDDPYYLGGIGSSVYKIWREEMRYVCAPGSPIVEWILTGSVGAGKTWSAMLALLYKGPYFCSCLKNPQAYLGLAPKSQIVFGVFNRILDSASLVDFSQALVFIDEGKYFKEKCPRRPGRGFIDFPSKNMSFRVGSTGLHALGQNLLIFLCDEVNYMQGGGDPSGQANQLYNQARRRMESRYLKYGYNPGLGLIVSSRNAQTSFLEEHMKEMRQQNNPHVHISDYTYWDTKGRDKFSDKTFRVAIGNERYKSQVLDEVDIAGGSIVKSIECPEGQSFIDVPVDFYSDFRRDVEGSLRDIAGLPTFAVSPLIKRPESVYECETPELFHPFVSESIMVPTSSQDQDLMLRLMEWDKITNIHLSARRLKLHPEQPRFIHCDLALSGDCAGLSCVHPYGFYSVVQRDPTTNQPIETFHPKIWVDFMVQIKPTHGAQIDITKIVHFILNLRNFGFSLMRATFDGFQSAMAIQTLNHAGQLPEYTFTYRNMLYNLESQVLSVDRNDVPYTLLRDQLNYGGIKYYKYQPFIDEITRLEHDIEKNKVDHPKKDASKDVSDSLCASVYSLCTSRMAFAMDPSEEVLGGKSGRVTVEDSTLNSIVGDYPYKNRLVEIIPPPTPDPINIQPRHHISNHGDIIAAIAKMMDRKR
jgi:hypothetical protein